jgi:ribulose-5-phosphate 4-epimerase/fuculose-1-phosphate aldolase
MGEPKPGIPPSDAVLRQARIDLAAAHRMAVFDGLNEGTWNHFTYVAPGREDCMLTSPGDRHWSQVTASNLVLLDRDGAVVGDGRADAATYCIHFPIHLAHPASACVLHAHPPYATALAMVRGGRLLMADQNALALYGRVAYFEEYEGFIADPEVGRQLARVLGDKRVLFMRSHGVLVVGPTVADAYTDLYHLERACMMQCRAMQMGDALWQVPAAIGRRTAGAGEASGYKLTHFEAMKRLLDAREPDYAG